jgi:hypothetical protein
MHRYRLLIPLALLPAVFLVAWPTIGGTPPAADAGDERAALERSRARVRLERDLEVAALQLAKVQIAVEHAKLAYRQDLSRAETAFELAKRRQQIFAKMTAPARIASAELKLQETEDAVRDQRAALQQLEATAGSEGAKDPEQAIAIERARRRLERAERGLELQRKEHEVLVEVMLPLEQMEMDLAAETGKHAVLALQRANEQTILARRIAVIEAESRMAALEHALDDLHDAGPSEDVAPMSPQPDTPAEDDPSAS